MLENIPLDITSLPCVHRGKVRDIYELPDGNWLLVASNRLSAFDVILPKEIEGKGALLTDISNFWFAKTTDIIPNHCIKVDLQSILTTEEFNKVESRCVTVKKLKALPIEAIVRGYLIGSGWQEYQKNQTVCSIPLPQGLVQGSQLDEPIYTPSTKAVMGQHDENISYEKTVEIIGKDLAKQIKDVSLKLYKYATEYAFDRGIIIADTKFEFGLDENNQLTIMDELLTPDSSRFWEKALYKPNSSPPSFDKQIVRDYLQTLDWDKSPPGPELPAEILDKTKQRYEKVIKLLKK